MRKSPAGQWDNRYDTVGVVHLIRGVKFGAILADKAFDSNWIVPLGRFGFTKSSAGQRTR